MEISLGAFIKFANASAQSRPRIARQIAEQARSDYDPATDFWRPMRQAINRDRKTSRDGEALRQLIRSAPTRRRASFEEISNSWDGVARRWATSEHATSSASRAEIGGLKVRLNPLFSERWSDGHVDAAYVWFNKEELQVETIDGLQRMLVREYHDENVEPVFIDMRRALMVPATDQTGDLDDWLDDLGHEFQRLAD